MELSVSKPFFPELAFFSAHIYYSNKNDTKIIYITDNLAYEVNYLIRFISSWKINYTYFSLHCAACPWFHSREVRTGGSYMLIGTISGLFLGSKSQWEILSQNIIQRASEEDSKHWMMVLYVYTYMFWSTHIHMRMNICTHVHKQTQKFSF